MSAALTSASDVSPFIEHVGVPILLALIAVGASLCVAVLSFALTRLGDSASRRREGYADAAQELLAWVEYPYRIKRRASDDAETLNSLAELGHTHQEALRYRRTWIRTESRRVAETFTDVHESLRPAVGQACNEAWSSRPVRSASDMTIGDWGPQDVDAELLRFEQAVATRFGWRRVLGRVGWHFK